MNDIVEKLQALFGSDCILSQADASHRPASVWMAGEALYCKALARPKSAEELAEIMRICHEYAQPVVPHGGLTGVAGGTKVSGDEIAITLERMNKIEEIDVINKTVTVQAGVILQDLQQRVAKQGFLFPLDLGAKGSCMIGGNIATNAGGLQALRYGVMRQLVLGLEVVLADGTIISSMNKMMKNNAGYDLKQLFIGSEGTLGIITKAVLRIEDAPQSRNTALVCLESFQDAVQFLHEAKKCLNSLLTTYEIIWQDYYQLMTSAPSPYSAPLPQNAPFYVLIEALGQNPQTDKDLFEELLENCFEKEIITDAALAKSQQELDWFWGIREQVELIFQVHNPVFLFDISLPINTMESYVEEIKGKLQNRFEQVECYAFGHMGDGNLHLFVSTDENAISTRHQVEEIVLTPLRAIGGSITAEHGVGLEKKRWLHLSRSQEEITLMKTLKAALDPKGILNRGKIFE
ncbi:FAD-binding oxidoreductase [Flectobacillus sp. BAB-3569]|uniref:FAD-binding oxidoreductase n=1 Tax=Flectobacillus sp. BAB-3569 TaxID=1509483 RepID=UPI000BA49FEC|nr:FAD-binding oxidoreductase [Flectobacillus sp. BAB-3569]PAC27316.1 FAD-binding oxidoreductase [Flectobacillus sp. BAB-3569]